MKPSLARLLVVIAAASLSCASSVATIPPGTYRSRSSEDYVRVEGERMAFFVQVDERPRTTVGAMAYGYLVFEDGRVHVVFTSAEALRGLGNYRYHWDGSELVMRHATTGEELVFAQE